MFLETNPLARLAYAFDMKLLDAVETLRQAEL